MECALWDAPRCKIVSLNLVLSLGALVSCGQTTASTETVFLEPSSERFEADKAWEELKGYFDLFYAYSDRMDFDIEAALDATQSRAINTTSKEEFRQEVARFGHIFGDPHIVVGPLADTDFNVVPSSSDLRIRYVSGEYVVEDVRARSAADKANIRPGFILKTIDQTAVEAGVSNIFAGLVVDPTARQRSHAATLLANGKRVGDRGLVFDNGVSVTLPNPRVFARSLQEQPALSVSYQQDIAIIRIHNSLGENDTIKAFDAAMIQTADATRIMLDLRETPGGGNTEVARSIMGHFVTSDRPNQTHTVPSLEREFTVPRKFTEFVLPRAPYRASSGTVVLGSYWTSSMGEGIVIGLDGAADMHVIASDMGDLLGGVSNYTLNASGIRLDIPSETLSHIDGTPREEFLADTPLRSANRDASGGDPALNAALLYLQSLQKSP